MNHPVKRFGDPRRVSHAGTRRPKHERLVSVTHIADVLSLVFIYGRVRIAEANALPDHFDIAGRASKESPTGAGMPGVTVCPDYVHVIFRGFQRDGVHENLAADLIAEKFLNLRQIGRDQWANFIALGVEEDR